MPIVIPAILTDNVEDYRAKLAFINDLVHDIHVDFTDEQFVPSQTVSLKDLIDIQRKPNTEAHLMVLHPERYLDECIQANIQTVLFHLEATKQPESVIKQIKARGLRVGIVLNPETSIDAALSFDTVADSIQLMGVHPGYYGRQFIPQTLDRLRVLHRSLRHAMLEVDGGVNAENIVEIAKTGVDRIVVGSAIFGADNPVLAYKKLKEMITKPN